LIAKIPVIAFTNVITDQRKYRAEKGITRDDVLDMIMKRTEKIMKNETEADRGKAAQISYCTIKLRLAQTNKLCENCAL